MTWTVKRHGGRRSDSWRDLYYGDDAKKAEAVYRKAEISLRQGEVRLEADGLLDKRAWAPRLRSNW